MCGLVGVAIKSNTGFILQQEDSFFQMLYADAIRGYDSTGVVGVTRNGDMYVAKEASEATWVIPQIRDTTFFKDKMSALKNEGKVWIGHNRKSTIGKTTDENAHPFVINNEFGFVHNGTLYNHEQLAKTDVDSKALAIVLHKAMGETEWKAALEETLGEVRGAYACVWYDQRTHMLNFLRNKDRPLAIIETPNAFYWASEPAMAWWILTRNNYRDSECKHIIVPEHTLMQINIDGWDNKLTSTEVVPKKAPTPVKTTGGSYQGYTTGGGNTTGGNSHKAKNRPPAWSKQQLKNFTKAHEGTMKRFWAQDYVETTISQTISQGATEIILLGDCDDILVKHTCRGVINLEELDMKGITGEELTQRQWMGTVAFCQYDDDLEQMIIHMDKIKPIVLSVPKKKDQPPFPKNPYTPTKVGTKALEERLERMKDQYENIGIPVTRKTLTNGLVQLINTSNNEVLYETAVALH